MELRRLGAEDAAAFWALRLRAFREEPEAFGSSYEENVGLYESFGFRPYGHAPRAMIFAGEAFDEELMLLEL